MTNKILTFCLFLLTGMIAKAQDTEEYIAEHVACAQGLMHDHKIPASVILAVAIHESAAGNSKIAQHLNNHFGVKGPNNNAEIHSSYRDYLNADESYSHFVEIMETREPFNNLFEKYDQYDYRGWTYGIRRCGYARSRSWASQVIGLIKKYELYRYDERPDGYEEPVYAAPVHRRAKNRRIKKIYTVKSGDNLSIIAKKKRTTVKALMRKNGMKKANLKPGRRIKF